MKTFNSKFLKLMYEIEMRLRLLIRFFDNSGADVLRLTLDQLDTVNFDAIVLKTWSGEISFERDGYDYPLLNRDMDIDNLCAIVDRYTDLAVKQGLVLDEDDCDR